MRDDKKENPHLHTFAGFSPRATAHPPGLCRDETDDTLWRLLKHTFNCYWRVRRLQCEGNHARCGFHLGTSRCQSRPHRLRIQPGTEEWLQKPRQLLAIGTMIIWLQILNAPLPATMPHWQFLQCGTKLTWTFLPPATSNDHEEIECHGQDGHHWHGWGLTRTTSIVSNVFNIIQPYNSAQLSVLHWLAGLNPISAWTLLMTKTHDCRLSWMPTHAVPHKPSVVRAILLSDWCCNIYRVKRCPDTWQL